MRANWEPMSIDGGRPSRDAGELLALQHEASGLRSTADPPDPIRYDA
jgi:hypothetical protein